jgi:hypothetical protein
MVADFFFHCTTGSGIGLNCSAEFCDLVFLNLVEKPSVLNPVFKNTYGIQHYGRYRDDIFVLVNSSHENRIIEMVSKLRGLCDGVYKLKVESMSSSSCIFLDVSVLALPNGRFSYTLYRKVTSQRVYLHNDAFHHYNTHAAWPVAEVGRIFRRCLRFSDFLAQREAFVQAHLCPRYLSVTPAQASPH